MSVLTIDQWDGKKTNVVINAPMEDVCKKMKIKSDLAFTSPPYGVGEILTTKSSGKKKVAVGMKYDSTDDGFQERDYFNWLSMIVKSSKISFWNVPAKQFEREFGVSRGDPNLIGHVIWKKPASVPFAKKGVIYFHENIWVFGDPKMIIKPFNSVWEFTQQYNSKHPAPFPPELPAKAIQHCTTPGQVVFDPFGGSGTTAAVAKALGREYITCDISPEYCRWIAERLDKTKAM